MSSCESLVTKIELVRGIWRKVPLFVDKSSSSSSSSLIVSGRLGSEIVRFIRRCRLDFFGLLDTFNIFADLARLMSRRRSLRETDREELTFSLDILPLRKEEGEDLREELLDDLEDLTVGIDA